MGTVLSVKNLKKEYPKFTLDNVSFEVEEGMIMGLIGRNGAGKTTTIKSILNLIHTSGGDIEYFGMSLNDQYSRPFSSKYFTMGFTPSVR